MQVGTKAVLSETNGTGNESGNGLSGSGGNRKWMPFPGRKLMTNDFVVADAPAAADPESGIGNRSGSGGSFYGSLGCVPVPSQENALVQDLIFCFIGVPGVHLKPRINNYKANRLF